MLRDAVAAAIGRENRSFCLRKNHMSTPEVRPGPETLNKKGFYNLMPLHVAPGRPLELDQEAITVAPVDVGFRPGLRPVPLSVVEAIAAGRGATRRSGMEDADTAAAAAAATIDGGQGEAEGIKRTPKLAADGTADTAGAAGCCLLKFPEVDAETGPVASSTCAATAPPSAECSPSLGPLGGRAARCGSGGGSGEGDDGSAVVASALLLSLRGVGSAAVAAAEEEGSGGSEAPTASISSSSEAEQTTPTTCSGRGSSSGGEGQGPHAAATEQEAAALRCSSASATTSVSALSPTAAALPASALRLDTTDATTTPTIPPPPPPPPPPPLPGVAAVGSEDAAVPTAQAREDRAAAPAAAAAALSAKAETEVLISTYVEVVPPESRWGEQFTVAVHRDSSVGDIRRAVWTEMGCRGLGPKRSYSLIVGGGVGTTDNQEERPPPLRLSSPPGEGEEVQEGGGASGTTITHHLQAVAAREAAEWTPAALRLRERQVKLPATIIRDVSGKVNRLRSQLHGAPWLLAAQVLPEEEHLGRPPCAAGGDGGGGGGGDSGGYDGGSTAAGPAPGGDGETGEGATAGVVAPPAEDAIVIVVQWWNRWEWRLTEKYEAWISPSETVASARRRLAEEVSVWRLACVCMGVVGFHFWLLGCPREAGGEPSWVEIFVCAKLLRCMVRGCPSSFCALG